MVGFWIFLIVLLICATIITCVFLYSTKENFPLWETKRQLRYITTMLEEMKEALAKMGGK